MLPSKRGGSDGNVLLDGAPADSARGIHASRRARVPQVLVYNPPLYPAGSFETMLMLAGWSPVQVQRSDQNFSAP